MSFFPPKNNLDDKDLRKILNVTFQTGLLDDELILRFLAQNQNLLSNESLSTVIFDSIKKQLDSTIGDLLIGYLESILWNYGQKNDTGFLIYTVHYILARKKYPEMMSFAYKKLPREAEMIEKLSTIILKLKEQMVKKYGSEF